MRAAPAALRIATRHVARVLVVAAAGHGAAQAATVRGLVYADRDGDAHPSAGEPGVAGAVVAYGVAAFATTDATGRFELRVPDGAHGLVWVRVPDGFTPGPVWARWDGRGDVELGLRPLPHPARGPITFVVAADTHIATSQDHVTAADLATAATAATALDPAPAFFTILGDITQGNRDSEFELVERALSGLGVPWVPVPGNHDWYDGGEAWFARWGPDNYSFDLGDVHFVVWNMALTDDEIRAYLGAELARVARDMTVVALTHAPPTPPAVDALRELGVDYVLTGHAHSNRPVDHDGVLELNTEPMLMGGLDFTPAGYRVITASGGRLATLHRTTLDRPALAIVSPPAGACVPSLGGALIVAAELDAAPALVTARVDCATPIALRPAGGWSWLADLPALAPGSHHLTVEAASASGARATAVRAFEVCAPAPPPRPGPDWPQAGGGPAHTGARAHELAPPIAARWVAPIGGHAVTAAPVIAAGTVFVAVTDLGDGDAGGIVALDLATGARRWRASTATPVRGGLAVIGDVVVTAQIDGVVIGFSADTGAPRWRHELDRPSGAGAQATAVFAAPAADAGDVLIGHQRGAAALSAATGTPLWTVDPVPDGLDSQSAAAFAIGEGLAIATFNRALGGVIAWDRATGKRAWSHDGDETVAINATPVIADGTVFVVSGAAEVTALDLGGAVRWRTRLDPDGFEWGNASIGTPAYARGVLVVPTLYRDLVALDAATGVELWRHAGAPGPLRTTHYRGGGEAGFAASPVIAGDVVWAVDTGGQLAALDLHTGRVMWRDQLGVPVLAGLAASGDALVVASYDGTVRMLAPIPRAHVPALRGPTACDGPGAAPGGCRGGASRALAPGALALAALLAMVAWIRRAGAPGRRR